MTTILLEEERESFASQKLNSNSNSTEKNKFSNDSKESSPANKFYSFELQPCLEYFMGNKIMEDLCALAQKDVSVECKRITITYYQHRNLEE